MSNSIDLSAVVDLAEEVCAREPIHLAGAIQPHGFLIGLDAVTLSLVTKSANIDTKFGPTQLSQ